MRQLPTFPLTRLMQPSALFLVGVVLCLACKPSITKDDGAALAAVRARFSSEFTIVLEDPVYMRVREARREVPDVDRKVRAVFDAFFLKDGKPRASSNIVYLNFLDYEGHFRYQLFFDRRKGEVVTQTRQDYY